MHPANLILKNGLAIHFRPGSADESVIQESFDNDIFLPGIPEYRLRPNHIILDIGAHIGCFSLHVAQQLKHGCVLAFEPSKESFDLLERNVTENKLLSIKPFHAAVADKNGRTLLYHDMRNGNWGHTITLQISDEAEEVDCLTLEMIVELQALHTIDFIKFNCEGAEFSILINTPPEILERVQCMLILYHGYLEDKINHTELAEYLRKNGFRIKLRNINPSDNSGWMIAYRATTLQNLGNVIRRMPLNIKTAGKWMRRKFARMIQLIKGKN